MARFWSVALALVVAVAALALTVPLLREASVRWYGIDFEGRAMSAAAKVAGDTAYCIYDDDRNILVGSFEDLHSRAMLFRAFDSRVGLGRGNRAYWPKPHFRLLLAGDTYYYSFKQRAFVKFHPQRWQLAGQLEKLCAAYRSSPREFRAAIQERHGIMTDEANFCCPGSK